jgi:hypothetical protein
MNPSCINTENDSLGVQSYLRLIEQRFWALPPHTYTHTHTHTHTYSVDTYI